MNQKVRVRFAPSPTGPLHIGGVRTALYNYLYAKKHNGKCILRIEDTDQTRLVKGAESYIINSLNWCGITFDESIVNPGKYGPYKQSERKDTGIYKTYAEELIKKKFAYYAFDTPEELNKMRENLKKAGIPAPQYNIHVRETMRNGLTLPDEEVVKLIAENQPYVIRIKIPRNEEIKFYDQIRGWVKVNSNNIDDKVLFKSDGMPTYHLANVVDDIAMEISHIIRGEEWLPSAPLHILLYHYLGHEDKIPKIAHLPLILKPDGNGKLSKRDGDRLGFPIFPMNWEDPISKVFSSGYKENGYFPEALVNTIAFLGWNPGTTREIFDMKSLIKNFSLERVGKSGAKFDPEKTKWFNQHYLREKSDATLISLIKPILKEQGVTLTSEENKLASICNLMKERAIFAKDILSLSYLFNSPKNYEEKVIKKKWKENSSEIMKKLITAFTEIDSFSSVAIHEKFNNFIAQDKSLKIGNVLPIFRLLITGKESGPSMFEICSILGKKETIKRVETGLKKLK